MTKRNKNFKDVIAQVKKRYIEDLSGATAIEYGLIMASVAIAVGAVAFLIGDELDTTFNTILTYLQQ